MKTRIAIALATYPASIASATSPLQPLGMRGLCRAGDSQQP